jgi:hypothetical protein
MRKLQLKALDIGLSERLTREQMKRTLGGHGIGSGPTTCNGSDCPIGQIPCIVLDSSCPSGCGSYCSPVCPVPPAC